MLFKIIAVALLIFITISLFRALASLVKAEGGGWVRRLDFQDKPVISAKDRSGRLPSRMDDPTWAKIAQALEATRPSK